MSQRNKSLRGIPSTTLRRLRYTPTYFFLIWRWTFWIYALVWIMVVPASSKNLLLVLLVITFIQSLIATLYTPVFKIYFPRLPFQSKGKNPRQDKQRKSRTRHWFRWRRNDQQTLAVDEEAEIIPPIGRSNNPYRDIAVYGTDVIICGLVMYFSAIVGTPPFGDGSPFYRYGFSSIFAAAFAYRYRGGLAAAIGYDFFAVLGLFFPPPMAHLPYTLTPQELLGSILDAPLIAILTAYMTTLLNGLTRLKRREQDSVRRQRSLLRVSETLVAGASNVEQLLQQSVKQFRQGGHFEYLVIALITFDENTQHPQIETFVESGWVEATPAKTSRDCIHQVAQSGEKLIVFEPQQHQEGETESIGLARLYLPFKKEDQVYMVIGAEMSRKTPLEERQENFLTIVGTQLMMALENLLLTEQAADLAAAAERGRIAREIHDGIAQLIYMLSLSSETCVALLRRISETSTEEASMLAPVSERLDKLVTISKQALWETRHYMFTLKPLMSGSTTLTQMVTNQLHEFEAISGLPVELAVQGTEAASNGDQRHARKIARVGTAIFRITQEALTNAYKHAHATQIHVQLHYQPQCIEVQITDDGKGLRTEEAADLQGINAEQERIYSGHGLRGMRERAEELGGTFQISPGYDGGTCVQASIPI
ncbi:MAG TPA: GAF domain-containing sensor histidine kinase [Ktedonobacteraceae bacterium]|nr:GAF domain-containing sensor histidine kinase [Ktedonobacteraceae bacterium]